MTHSSRLSAFCEKIIEAGWIAAVVLTPLFFNVYSSRVFEPDKLTLLRSIALLMIGAWIIKWIEERGHDNGERLDRVTRRTPLVLPTLILIGVYLVTSVLSIAPHVSFMGSYQRLQGTYTFLAYVVVFWMILVHMRRREQLDRIVTTIVMTSLPIAFYGLLQHGEIDPLPWGGDVTVRVAANMGNAIFVAAYLIMAFFLTMGRVVDSFRTILSEQESRLSDILRASAYVFVAAVQLIAFGFADSRGPLLGWLPGMFIFGLVGLLLLRVTLHLRTAPADADPTAIRYPIVALDVLKALGMAVVSVAGAGLGALLIFKLLDPVKIALVVVVALLGGLMPLLIVAGLRRAAARWLWASWIFFSLIVAVGLAIINFSDHPTIVGLRQSGAFGRLSALFETEGGTGEVRSLIWQGVVKLVTPHDPITFPDGSKDNLNAIRPLIGYGPEAMYVAYNPFYPPDLAHLEARNASPDRSHNETWDSLVITGGIGFLAEQFLFLSVFYFALKFIGWIPSRRSAITLFAMMIVGGVVGTIALGVGFGAHFMGTGWPGGVTAGLVLYVITFALFHYQISRSVYILIAAILIAIIDAAILLIRFTSPNLGIDLAAATGAGLVGFAVLYLIGRGVFEKTADQPIALSGHIFVIIALFGAILAHYLEISLAGIAIAATRTYFWTFAALLIITGLHWVPAEDEAAKPLAAPAPTPSAPPAPTNVPRHKKKSQRQVVTQQSARREAKPRPMATWLAPVITLALIGTLILVTLGYEFINNPPQNPSSPSYIAITNPTQLIASSLTRLPYKDNRESPGALLMFGVTWLFGGVLSLTELRRRNVLAAKDVLPAIGVYYGVSIVIALIYWLIHAGQLFSFAALIPNTQPTTLDQYAQRVNDALVLAESVASLLVLLYFTILLLIIGLGASMMLERRTWYGETSSEWGLAAAVPIMLAVVIAVNGTNLNAIRADTIYKQYEPLRAQGQNDLAIAHLKRVIELAPDEDFYYLWLGAAYLEKGSQAQDAAPIFTPNSTLAGMLKLSVQQTYQLGRQDLMTVAQAVLNHARDLNPLNTDHTANLARLYRRWADLSTTDPAQRKARLEQSSEQYRIATTLSPNNAILWNEWTTVYISLGDLARAASDTAGADADYKEAQTRIDHSLEIDEQFETTYLIRGQLNRALGQQAEANGNKEQADQYYNLARQSYEGALKWNPNSTDGWGRLTDLLVSRGNYTDVEKITLDFLQMHPDYLPALRTLARNVYFQQGRIQEALATQQHAVQVATANKDPNAWDDQRVLAILLAQTGQLPQALQTAQSALEIAPKDQQPGVQQLVAQIQVQMGLTVPVTSTLPITTTP